MMELDDILRAASRLDASDVLLKPGVPPGLRLHGDLMPLPQAAPMTADDVQAAVDLLLDEYHRKRFAAELQADLAYETASAAKSAWSSASFPPASAPSPS
jgi:twitching motility protein PilT